MTTAKKRVLLAIAPLLLVGAAIVFLTTSSCACGRSNPKPAPAIRRHIINPNPGGPAVSVQRAAPRSTNCVPAASQTMSNTVSHLCGFADTTNTGVPEGAKLYRVPQDITAPTTQTGHGWTWDPTYGGIAVVAGGLVTNIRVTGTVNIQGNGATVENSDITTSGMNSWAIQLRHARDATIKNNNMHGTGTAVPNGCDSAIRDVYGDSENLTAQDNNVWYCADPMNNIADGGLIEQNYFHDFGAATTDNHYEGIQFEPGSAKLMTVRDNTILNSFPQTAAIILSNDGGGTETNRAITHNLLAGGGYCFYGAGGSSTPSSNITFRNNTLSRLYYPACGSFGSHAYWTSTSRNVWSGNRWDGGTSAQP